MTHRMVLRGHGARPRGSPQSQTPEGRVQRASRGLTPRRREDRGETERGALSEHGMITRQEAVSMIPPLLLDVEPNDKVLDMCAAPGSKTSQLLELMHLKAKPSQPTGMVLANEIKMKRANFLTTIVQR